MFPHKRRNGLIIVLSRRKNQTILSSPGCPFFVFPACRTQCPIILPYRTHSSTESTMEVIGSNKHNVPIINQITPQSTIRLHHFLSKMAIIRYCTPYLKVGNFAPRNNNNNYAKRIFQTLNYQHSIMLTPCNAARPNRHRRASVPTHYWWVWRGSL